jgi:ElaB/YqjD/DUF883 family membrane-anchored ribosome-binding protein
MQGVAEDNGALGKAREERSVKEAVREAARKARAAGNQEVQKLLLEVEELIERVSESADPEVARVRGRVTEAVARTRRAMFDRAAGLQRQAREVLVAGDTFVHDQPWEVIGAAALAGLAIGFLMFRR